MSTQTFRFKNPKFASSINSIQLSEFKLIAVVLLISIGIVACVGEEENFLEQARTKNIDSNQSTTIMNVSEGQGQEPALPTKDRLAIFGGTGMTGSVAVAYALDEGHKVKMLVRNESTIPESLKSHASYQENVEIVIGDVLNPSDVEKTLEKTDSVVILLGTRNDPKPTTLFSEGTKNIIEAMKKLELKRVSACMSSFLFMPPDAVPKVFHALNADHKKMLDLIKESDLEYRAILPPHISDEPSAPFQVAYDKTPGRKISKYDLGKFFIDSLADEEHARKVIGIATLT